MRVLYLNPIAQMGGAETSLLELLAAVRAAEPDWKLMLAVGADGPLVAKATRAGVEVRVLRIPDALAKFGDSRKQSRLALIPAFFAAIHYVWQLTNLIRSERPDLIHSTGFKMHVLSAWASPAGIPLIWHIHDYVSPRPLMSRILRWCGRKCAGIIVNSESVAADVRRVLGERTVPIDCVHNAIDLDRFSPYGARLDLDALSNLQPAPEGTVRVGLIATLAWWKGHRVFLRALSILPAGTRIRGYVVGGPVYQTAGSQESLTTLRSDAASLGLDDQVGFTGHIDDTASAIRALDIVVHASTEPEPFGMVIAEGMGCGKAVIVSAAGGAQELFRPGVDAISHRPGDAAELAEQILRLVQDSELRSSIGRAGRKNAELMFAGHRLSQQVLLAYERQGVSRSRPKTLAAVS